jgi:hypothetical protein
MDDALERVNEIWARRGPELIGSIEGATGGGIGATDGEPVIRIFLLSEDDRPAEPASLEGVPVEFVVTGPFRAL